MTQTRWLLCWQISPLPHLPNQDDHRASPEPSSIWADQPQRVRLVKQLLRCLAKFVDLLLQGCTLMRTRQAVNVHTALVRHMMEHIVRLHSCLATLLVPAVSSLRA